MSVMFVEDIETLICTVDAVPVNKAGPFLQTLYDFCLKFLRTLSFSWKFDSKREMMALELAAYISHTIESLVIDACHMHILYVFVCRTIGPSKLIDSLSPRDIRPARAPP